MNSAKQHPKPKTNSTEGLEELFDGKGTVKAASINARISQARGLTIREAVAHYRLSANSIRLKIKLGEIAALKVDGPKGPEWRIFPTGLPQNNTETNELPSKGECTQQESIEPTSNDPIQECKHPAITVQPTAEISVQEHNDSIGTLPVDAFIKLIESNKELQNKVESATYRNGYLEAQLENHKDQIKLLTDSQHKASWWRRFTSWALGSPSVR